MNFLPGWSPGFLTAIGITSIAFFNSSTSDNGTTITAPASILAGDIIFLVDVSTSATTLPTQVVPTDFTSLQSLSDGTNFLRMEVSYKIANGTEGGASITGMVAGSFGRTAKAMLVFRPDKAAAAASFSTVNNQYTTGNPTAQNVVASGGTPPLVVLGFYGAFNDINPRTFSPAKDGEAGVFSNGSFADACAYAAYKIYNTAPADVSIDMDDEGTGQGLVSCYVRLS